MGFVYQQKKKKYYEEDYYPERKIDRFDAVRWKSLIREFTIHTGNAKSFNEQDTAFT